MGRASGTVAGPPAQRPLKFGGRFSRKADALLEVVGAEQRQQLQEHVVDVLLERLGLGHAHHALDGPHRERRVGGDLDGQLSGGVGQLGVGHDPVHETELERLLGQQRAAREGDLGRLGVADEPGQQPRAAALGQDAPLGEAGVELGRLRRRRGCRSRGRGPGRSRRRRRSGRRSWACRRCAARSAARRAARTRPGCVQAPQAAEAALRALAWAERSRPAQNARPAPVSTMARTSRSRSAASSASESRASIGPEIVFMRSGAFSVMVATWSATSYQDLVAGAAMAAPYAGLSGRDLVGAMCRARDKFVSSDARANGSLPDVQ